MNRHILFRAKRKDNGEWVYGYYATQSNHACFQSELKYTSFILKDEFMDWGLGGLAEYEVIPESVGQFTGLTDKNGKKIFENDIIADDEEYSTFENTRKGIVKFYHGEFTSFYGQDLLGRDCYDPLYSVCKERYVIGNIYDNPELEEE